MTTDQEEIQSLKAEVASLRRDLGALHKQFAITHHLAIALAQQCNSPEILRSNFNEIAGGSHDQLLYSTLTDDDIAALKSLQEQVDKQLPEDRH